MAASLQCEVLAPATDIRGASDRARLFFGEPRTHSGGSTDEFLLITDGVGTRRPEAAPPLPGTVRVVVVNGAGSVETRSSLEPVSFEGIDAAMRWFEAGHEARPAPPIQ